MSTKPSSVNGTEILNGAEALRELSARTIFLHQAVADHLGLNITDHKCLDIVLKHGPMTAGRLAEDSSLTTGAITGVVDRLEKKGFVRRVAAPQDRRKTMIEVVPEGVRQIEQIFADLAQKTAEIVARYSQAERAAIDDFAHQTAAMIDAFVRDLRNRKDP
ncbi:MULTISPECIES: MarR family transcriptional regulator [unclassified Beijerinckia]|uniref:MarR family winged helix-turn-helix transcriptional regulator n=1 Tax=unclassified Beijerinckia TaxID=2638183 RepID=UPI000B81BBF6|nr:MULTISPECIES: MarR family transcriptional regulator [unclassified Beijerinckia]